MESVFTKQFVSYKSVHIVAFVLAKSDYVKQQYEVSVSHHDAQYRTHHLFQEERRDEEKRYQQHRHVRTAHKSPHIELRDADDDERTHHENQEREGYVDIEKIFRRHASTHSQIAHDNGTDKQCIDNNLIELYLSCGKHEVVHSGVDGEYQDVHNEQMSERDGVRRHFLQPQAEDHLRRKDEGNGDEEHREVSGFGSQAHQRRAAVQIARSIILHYLRRDGFLRIVGKGLQDGSDGIGYGKSGVHRGAEEHVDDERSALRLAYRGNGSDADTDGEIEHVIILAPLTHEDKAGDGSKLPTAIGEEHHRGEGGHECHDVGIDNQLVLEMVDEQISEEQLEKAHRHVRGAEHEEALTGYEQSVIGHADERHGCCHDGDIKDTQHSLHVTVIADMVHDIPMSGGQGYRHGQQGNEHMYDKIDIKLTAHLLLVLLANGYGNETVGRGHHNGVDDAYEGDDAGYDRIESVVAYTQSLQTEACIEQSAYGYDGESDVKDERVYRY